MRHLFLLLALFIFCLPGFLFSQPLYKNADAPVDERVEDLLSKMTLYEKIGQMTQLNITMINPTYDQNDVVLVEEQARDLIQNHHIGSFLNGGAVPPEQWFTFMDKLTRLAVEESRLDIPIIYGMDHVHGANYLGESTIFPQGINLAATFNPDHAYEMGWVTALETADIGHHWNFAPILDLGVNPQWPRFWETFGEDPYLASRLGQAYINGLQGNEEIAPYKIAGTAKHFLAYSNPETGWDRTPVQIGMQAIHEIHRPAFQAAIDAGIKTVMLNSGEVNGVPVHASKKLVTDLLRNEMGFDGVVLTDWEDIGKLQNFHKVARDYKEATLMAIEAGVDMSMTPTSLEFNEALLELTEEGRITEDRIDESVRRILRLKFELGLFENPYPRDDRLHRIGSEESAEKNLQAAEESIVLLRNTDRVLPLDDPRSILLFGPSANSKRNLSGGWTLEWQGAPEEKYPEDMNTIYSALQNRYPQADIQIITELDLSLSLAETEALIQTFNEADMLVYAGGEEPYTEFIGNITSMKLPENQLDEISFLSRSDTPLAFIYIGGRPRLVSDVILQTDAFIFAGLPGFEGADAIANIISGEVNPSGKLPFSYPQYPAHHVPYNHKPSATYFFDPSIPNNISQAEQNTSLYPFGSGLSYTTYEYSNLTLSDTTLTRGKTIEASVTVTNTGDRPGMESVLWYVTDEVGKITRPVKELKYFQKTRLKSGESRTLQFTIDPMETLSYPDEDGNHVLEWGDFNLQVGPLQQNFTLEKEEREYSMIWSDEFTGSSLDTTVWNFWEGTAYNNELQYYTDRPENIFVEDGKLHIRAQKEDYGGMDYTSARISTDSTSIGWKHGRFEAKIKMPDGKGFWPAFWLMPIRDIGWPRGGEIDIMEFRGNEPNTTTGAIHFYQEDCDGSSVECRKYYTDSITLPDTNLTEEFHIYALEWTEDELVWYLDDTEFMRIELSDVKAEYNPFSTPFYIILNLAVGGDFLDNPDETTPFPQSLVVDYVRVYQKN